MPAQDEGDKGAVVDPQGDPTIVLTLLEADQLVAAKRTRLGRRQLTPWEAALLWALRLYVLALLAVVVLQMVRTWPGG